MRRILLVLIALLIPALLLAQGITGKGPKLGLNMANMYGDDVEDNKMYTRFAFGGFLTYSLNDKMAIQPEIYYSMKGYKIESSGYGVTVTIEVTLDYLEIPVLFKYNFPGETIKPNLYVGPALGILLGAKVEEEDIKDDTKSTDFGLVIGGGITYPIGNGAITGDIRYNLGLTSVDDTGADEDIKNNVIQILVGYSF